MFERVEGSVTFVDTTGHKRRGTVLFDDIDVLAAPCVPSVAPEVGARDIVWADGTTEDITSALVRLPSPGNLIGLPTLALPVGFDPAGLPLGMQVLGRPFDEATVLRVGHAYEMASDSVGRLAPV